MQDAETLRLRADTCAEQAIIEKDAIKKRRFERLADGWKSLAETQMWLDGGVDPLIQRAP